MLSTLRRDEDGVTLVELLVIIVLLGTVGSVVMASVISGTRAVRKADARVAALNDLQLGLDRIGRELRAADPMLADPGGDYSRKLGARIVRGGETVQHEYYLDTAAAGTDLKQDIDIVAADGTLTPVRHGVFITRIANDEQSPPVPVFTYYDRNGTEVTCADIDPADPEFATRCRSRHLTAAQVRIVLMKVLDEQDPIRLETVINIRNMRVSG
jgi:type II secretory pathway pseudopilin PulG